MNRKQRMLLLAAGFLIMGLWVSIVNLNAVFILGTQPPFPPISTILGVTGIALIYWSDRK